MPPITVTARKTVVTSAAATVLTSSMGLPRQRTMAPNTAVRIVAASATAATDACVYVMRNSSCCVTSVGAMTSAYHAPTRKAASVTKPSTVSQSGRVPVLLPELEAISHLLLANQAVCPPAIHPLYRLRQVSIVLFKSFLDEEVKHGGAENSVCKHECHEQLQPVERLDSVREVHQLGAGPHGREQGGDDYGEHQQRKQ